MLMKVVLLALGTLCYGLDNWTDQNPNDEKFMSIAWDAASSVINNNVRRGRFMVPKKIMEARKKMVPGVITIEIISLFQEAWCGPDEGNSPDEICESMCPFYHGGAEAIYKITSIGDRVTAVKVEDVIPLVDATV